MAFVVAPSAGANSYASVADAVAYAADQGLSFTGDTADQQTALVRASTALDGKYGSSYPGARTGDRTQGLMWPRTGAYDTEGAEIGTDEIPTEIIAATVQMASRELTSPNSLSPDVVEGNQRVLVGVDSISWQVTAGASGVDAQRPVLTVVDDILKPLIGGKSGMLLRS